MKQIEALQSRLEDIGFDVLAHENLLQIVGISADNDALNGIDLDKVSHAIQVVIEVEDPESVYSKAQKIIFQNCSLKVYFEGWELQDLAKIIKFNIAGILNDHGIFYGMNFEFPKSHEEVLVP
jgi:hypothetical protein